MLGVLMAAVVISTSFAGGSLGRVEQVTPTHLRCAVKGQTDKDGRNRQANWYYFRLDNLQPHGMQIDFRDLVGEYDFHAGSYSVTPNTRPVYSYDNRHWTHFSSNQVTWDGKQVQLTVRFKPAGRTMWIAHMAPYTRRNLDQILAPNPYLKTRIIGHSVHHRDIPLLTITDSGVPDTGKKVVWIVARQHAWEAGTSWVADGAVRFLLSNDKTANRLRRLNIFMILPMFDPDGVAEGSVRFNANGYDTNRNWDAVKPDLMPEIAAARSTILGSLDAGGHIDVLVAMHNTEDEDYIEAPLKAGDASVKAVAEALVKQLRVETSFYDPLSPRESMGDNPIPAGQMDIDQDLFSERKIPAFLMELMIDRNPRLGRPRTEADFVRFGAGLVKSLAAAVEVD